MAGKSPGPASTTTSYLPDAGSPRGKKGEADRRGRIGIEIDGGCISRVDVEISERALQPSPEDVVQFRIPEYEKLSVSRHCPHPSTGVFLYAGEWNRSRAHSSFRPGCRAIPAFGRRCILARAFAPIAVLAQQAAHLVIAEPEALGRLFLVAAAVGERRLDQRSSPAPRSASLKSTGPSAGSAAGGLRCR